MVAFDNGTAPALSDLLPTDTVVTHVTFCRREELANTLQPACGFERCLSFSFSDDCGIKGELKAILARHDIHDIEIKSVVSDLLVQYLSRDLELAAPAALDTRIADLAMYAIACTPRSGSTYLAALLRSVGLGKPEEHPPGTMKPNA